MIQILYYSHKSLLIDLFSLQKGNSASAGAISDHTTSNLSSLSFRGSSSGKSGSSPEESSSDIVLHRVCVLVCANVFFVVCF